MPRVARDTLRILRWLLDRSLLILPRGSVSHRPCKMCRVLVWVIHCAFYSGVHRLFLGMMDLEVKMTLKNQCEGENR